MTKRQLLEMQIESNHQTMEALKKLNIELRRDLLLLSDDKQWFVEKEEDCVVKRRPKIIERHLIGRVHWIEYYKDVSTNEDFPIERNEIVRIDGVWQ